MPTPSSPSSTLQIHVYGHDGADPEAVAHAFGGVTNPTPEQEADVAIFAINPAHGIDQDTIEQWENLNDSMVPRLVVVTGLESEEADFDDAVTLANRVFDAMVTPYLVLHDEAGLPCALISLQDLTIRDYSNLRVEILESEPEHKTLVTEFQKEFLTAMEIAGDGGFAAGILFPAVPLWLERGIGIDLVQAYLAQINL